MIFDVGKVFSRIPGILGYLPVTMELVVVSTAFSLLFGFLIAIVKIRRIPVLRQITAFYVSFSRGTPAIVQLYLFFYGIPLIFTLINREYGTTLPTVAPSMLTALVAFTFSEASYSSETIRAALGSVDRGQMEAALSIGMTQKQAYLRIILPEALVFALPPFGNAFIGQIKNTSLAFTCAVVEMTAGARLLASRDYRFFESYVSLAIIYWILIIITSKLLEIAEKKLKRDERITPDDSANKQSA
jgi:polar amino acid transport system permease protein